MTSLRTLKYIMTTDWTEGSPVQFDSPNHQVTHDRPTANFNFIHSLLTLAKSPNFYDIYDVMVHYGLEY